MERTEFQTGNFLQKININETQLFLKIANILNAENILNDPNILNENLHLSLLSF